MATAQRLGYRKGLVDLAGGQQPASFLFRQSLPVLRDVAEVPEPDIV
jgi:hypothetical protein